MIKNYTSQISAKQSINNIEEQLVKHGARKILRLYGDDKLISGICFELPHNGQEIPYKLLARIKECEVILLRNMGTRTRSETRKKAPKQAERTAWKILSDHIDIQMARVELGQIEITEAYLTYMYDHKRDQTFYEKIKDKGFGHLLEYKE
jgi:hypothetical protein